MKRSAGMWAVLLATLACSAWLATQDDEDAVALARKPGPREAVPASSGLVVANVAWPPPPAARASESWAFDAQQALAWSAPPAPAPAAASQVVAAPPAPVVPVAAATPHAPPFPYVLIGRIEEGRAVHALLSGPAQTLGVKVEDVIDGQWRVDAIDARGLVVTWLPGGLRQTVLLRPS